MGVHSAKATLLSWARQLNLSESLHRIQGHHKPVGSESSVHLYGRGDIGPMLLLQQDIRRHIHSRFRPCRHCGLMLIPFLTFGWILRLCASTKLSSSLVSSAGSESDLPGWDVIAHCVRSRFRRLNKSLTSLPPLHLLPPQGLTRMTSICRCPGCVRRSRCARGRAGCSAQGSAHTLGLAG